MKPNEQAIKYGAKSMRHVADSLGIPYRTFSDWPWLYPERFKKCCEVVAKVDAK